MLSGRGICTFEGVSKQLIGLNTDEKKLFQMIFHSRWFNLGEKYNGACNRFGKSDVNKRTFFSVLEEDFDEMKEKQNPTTQSV